MTAVPSGSWEVLEELARAVEAHGGGYGVRAHARVLDLCAEAVSFARELDPAGGVDAIGLRARSSARLLLELVCPYLDRTSVHELSLACERAAVRLP
jgi:hypothetical protein